MQRVAFRVAQSPLPVPLTDQGTQKGMQKPQHGIKVQHDEADGDHGSAGHGQFCHDSLQRSLAFGIAKLAFDWDAVFFILPLAILFLRSQLPRAAQRLASPAGCALFAPGSVGPCLIDFIGVDAGGIEEVLAEVFVQAEEVLEKRVLTDLGDGLFVGDTEALLDDECSQRDAAFLGGSAHAAVGEVGAVVFLHQMPGDDAGELHPAVVGIKLAAKRQVEVGQIGSAIGAIQDFGYQTGARKSSPDIRNPRTFSNLSGRPKLVESAASE